MCVLNFAGKGGECFARLVERDGEMSRQRTGSVYLVGGENCGPNWQ